MAGSNRRKWELTDCNPEWHALDSDPRKIGGLIETIYAVFAAFIAFIIRRTVWLEPGKNV